MAEALTKLPVKTEQPAPPRADAPQWPLLTSLRREVDRLFDDFDGGSWRRPLQRALFGAEPFWSRDVTWANAPAADVVEKDKAYEVAVELPGMDESNIDVKIANDTLTIKGERKEEKEEKKKDYYLSERRFGSFERSFQLPRGVDKDKIEAAFKKGVLTVTLPKTAEAQKTEKKIAIKAS